MGGLLTYRKSNGWSLSLGHVLAIIVIISLSLSFDGNEIGSGTENPSSTMHKHAPHVQPNVCTCNCIGHITCVFASPYIHIIHAHTFTYTYGCLPSPSHRVIQTASYTSFPCHLQRPLQILRVIPWRKHWFTCRGERKKKKHQQELSKAAAAAGCPILRDQCICVRMRRLQGLEVREPLFCLAESKVSFGKLSGSICIKCMRGWLHLRNGSGSSTVTTTNVSITYLHPAKAFMVINWMMDWMQNKSEALKSQIIKKGISFAFSFSGSIVCCICQGQLAAGMIFASTSMHTHSSMVVTCRSNIANNVTYKVQKGGTWEGIRLLKRPLQYTLI